MQSIQCWCGSTELESFSPDYQRCRTCGTLVLSHPPAGDITRVTDEEADFYGERYWFSHQEHLGLPDITRRARLDLPERNLHWLNTLLKYKLPPGAVLELGSAHGSFIALLRWAGFDATGLELSPKIVEFARRTFDIPVLLGPIEDQDIKPGSLDAIVLMDVLEHLPDPVGTMRRCLDLLKPDGVLIVQTPKVSEDAVFEEMVERDDPFLNLLAEPGHLYLFGEQSVRELFARLGAEHLLFEPAIFAHYDMFFVASRVPVEANTAEAIEASLAATPGGRLVQALLDLRQQLYELTERYAESEADRNARFKIIQAQERQLRAARAAARDLQIAIEASSKIIQAQERQLRAARAAARDLQLAIGASSMYRLLRKLGRWEYHTRKLEQLNRALHGEIETLKDAEEVLRAAQSAEVKLKRIAVDLTPVLPGGDNGGAKLVAITLVQQLSRLLPDCTFTLLTSGKSHDELAFLDGPNVHRVCVIHQDQSDDAPETAARARAVRRGLKEWLGRFMTPGMRRKATALYTSLFYRRRIQRNGMKAVGPEFDVDLIFCPFTAPLYVKPGTPIVSVIYDLQYLYYPQFFTPEERLSRDKTFRDACRLADRLVCISDYVRGTVLEHGDVAPEKVHTVHLSPAIQCKALPPESVEEVLGRFNLANDRFLLYPANFWRHKNHMMLLTAFGMYRNQHPESDLKLVLTGASVGRMGYLQEAVRTMGLQDWVVMPGFLPDDAFVSLLQSCRALIFPSLYEGFGMPVLEAMAAGKPVLCSNLTSLPEVAGDAALYFDPRKPAEICEAIERIESDPELRDSLIEKGDERVNAFGNAEDMARKYLAIFQDVVRESRL